jgi:hypothetical protein
MTNTPTTDTVKNTLDEFTSILLDKVFDKLYEKANDYQCKNSRWCYCLGTDEYNTAKALETVAEKRYDFFKKMVSETMGEMTMTLWNIEMDEMNKC